MRVVVLGSGVVGVASAWYLRQAGYVRGAGHDGPGRDWRMIRAAEASAREIGMRASIPDQSAAGTPEYAADLARWGDGRGAHRTRPA